MNDIEILNASGDVITKVADSSDPAADMAAYGGDSWRLYVEPDANRIERKRAEKIGAIKSHALGLISALSPAMANLPMLELVLDLHQSGAFAAGFPAPGSDFDNIRLIYQYAKTRIVAAQSASETQLDNYDPATDPNWP